MGKLGVAGVGKDMGKLGEVWIWENVAWIWES